jgi:hypothetical protein
MRIDAKIPNKEWQIKFNRISESSQTISKWLHLRDAGMV